MARRLRGALLVGHGLLRAAPAQFTNTRLHAPFRKCAAGRRAGPPRRRLPQRCAVGRAEMFKSGGALRGREVPDRRRRARASNAAAADEETHRDVGPLDELARDAAARRGPVVRVGAHGGDARRRLIWSWRKGLLPRGVVSRRDNRVVRARPVRIPEP